MRALGRLNRSMLAVGLMVIGLLVAHQSCIDIVPLSGMARDVRVPADVEAPDGQTGRSHGSAAHCCESIELGPVSTTKIPTTRIASSSERDAPMGRLVAQVRRHLPPLRALRPPDAARWVPFHVRSARIRA